MLIILTQYILLAWLMFLKLTQLYQLGEKSEQHQGMRPGGLHYIR